MDLRATLTAVSGLAVTFLVPAVVWTTLIAGIAQLVYDGIRRLGTKLSNLHSPTQRSVR